jgi:thiamine biosynthesis lipoprotein
LSRDVLVPLDIRPALPAAGSVLHRLGGASMGTTWSARLMMPPAAPDTESTLGAALQGQLDEVVAQMSHWDSGSDLSRFNAAPAGSWQRLPADMFGVLAYALRLAEDSGGAYDPGAGALVNAWGFGAERRYNQPGFQPPAGARIAARLAERAAARIELDAATLGARQPGGVQLDLSSIAKGFAVDQMARLLHSRGIGHYLIELGGELRGAGMKPDGQPWWVAAEGIPDSGAQGDAGDEARIALHGLALATSGDYRRYFQYGERRAAHTLDPRTGSPLDNGVASVSVLHAECMAADALSTALCVLGPEQGLAFAEARRLAARFLVRAGGSIRSITTAAWRAMLR